MTELMELCKDDSFRVVQEDVVRKLPAGSPDSELPTPHRPQETSPLWPSFDVEDSRPQSALADFSSPSKNSNRK